MGERVMKNPRNTDAATQGPLDREALGRIAWDAWWSMLSGPGESGDWIALPYARREMWCRAAEAVASAVRAAQPLPVEWRPGEGLTPVDRLKRIADLVSGLPHGPGTPGPGLELGESAEAFALLTEQTKRIDVPHLKRGEYVSVCINGLWIGASMPKTEGK